MRAKWPAVSSSLEPSIAQVWLCESIYRMAMHCNVAAQVKPRQYRFVLRLSVRLRTSNTVQMYNYLSTKSEHIISFRVSIV